MKKPTPTLEELFTSPSFFGVTTATPVQRAICRACEGLPLGELAEHPDVVEAFGGAEAVALLAPGGVRPREVDLLGGIRAGKSVLVAAHAWWCSQVADMSRVRPGEIPRYPLLSVNTKSAEATFNHLAGTILARPLMRALLVGEIGADSLVVRSPSGKPVEIAVAAGARAGANVISVFLCGAAFEEYPRQASEAAGAVVNYDSQLQSASGRVLDGGQILSAGAPWGPTGPAWERFSSGFGRPTADRVIVRATGPQMNPSWWSPQRCAALQRSNPTAYTCDVLAQFADPSSALVMQSQIKHATRRDGPAILPCVSGHGYVAAMDPGTRGNSWTLVVVGGWQDADGVARYEVALAREWKGSSEWPLVPSEVLKQIASLIFPYHKCAKVFTDQHSADAIRDAGSRIGLDVQIRMVVAGNAPELAATGKPPKKGTVYRNDMYETMAGIFASEAITIPDDRTLVADLLSVRRVNGRSTTYDLPSSADARHCDYVPALALALSMFPSWEEKRVEVATRARTEWLLEAIARANGERWAIELQQQRDHAAQQAERAHEALPEVQAERAKEWERIRRHPPKRPPLPPRGGGRGGGRKLW